jgi:AcrR family transcriptional regulator
MKKSRRRNARKPPQQSRSRVTVTAILDATIRIFERENYEAATTTHIAEVAGISIGTLYQYFADRDAILDALQDRELERATEMLEHALSSTDARSGPEIARRVVAGLMQLYRAAPALHRVLVIEGLRVTPTERVQAFDLRMVQRIRGFLASTPVPIRRTNLDVAAFVAYHSVRATMLARLLEPVTFDDDELVDELVDLVLRYLVVDANG